MTVDQVGRSLVAATSSSRFVTPNAVGAEQQAPLGRAVIGRLAASTVATLLVLLALFALVQRRATTMSASLDPDGNDEIRPGTKIVETAADR